MRWGRSLVAEVGAVVSDQVMCCDRVLMAGGAPAWGAVACFYGVIRKHDPAGRLSLIHI